MEKIMLWLHRPSNMGPDEFDSYYLERHVPRLLGWNGSCRYVAILADVKQFVFPRTISCYQVSEYVQRWYQC